MFDKQQYITLRIKSAIMAILQSIWFAKFYLQLNNNDSLNIGSILGNVVVR